jgi:hypothetical protein
MARRTTAKTLGALRHRNFQLFFARQAISLTGTWMDSVAQAWLIYPGVWRIAEIVTALSFSRRR